MTDRKLAITVAWMAGVIVLGATFLLLVLAMLTLLAVTGAVYPGWGIFVPLVCVPLALAAATHAYRRATTLEDQ